MSKRLRRDDIRFLRSVHNPADNLDEVDGREVPLHLIENSGKTRGLIPCDLADHVRKLLRPTFLRMLKIMLSRPVLTHARDQFSIAHGPQIRTGNGSPHMKYPLLILFGHPKLGLGELASESL